MSLVSQNKPTSLYTPRHWPTWIWIGLLRLIALLPYGAQLKIGKALGVVLYHLARRRRHITEVNLRLCFPELDDKARDRMAREVFIHNAIGVMEAGMAWWAPKEWFRERTQIKGREHLDAALKQGCGVILLGAHFTTLDLGGVLLGFYYPFNTMYRRHNNPVLEEVIDKGRSRTSSTIERSNLRQVLRALRANEIIWYAPDQDFGAHQSVYAPFFGVQAATITATSRLVKLNQSPILMISQHRLPDNRYEVEIYPIIKPFPTGDDVADATRINQEIERAIRKDPAQYMWVHRRFKTHPKGKNYLYRH
ncbi:LpxL/LpxP family Kdo(2)-lipid IV(A) lauroyl/palmitoleoyl acyltransferase [Nitrincola sp. MINF-07-Sa-05]|uniref:LpxL/LpxP family Kdo(2)-lipid IV(A) lauroyl/palmitoleoyl acyltransferase n=1 Tax=Nitrincola salilacus TaxID=3400273 RepID=UPI0039181A2B